MEHAIGSSRDDLGSVSRAPRLADLVHHSEYNLILFQQSARLSASFRHSKAAVDPGTRMLCVPSPSISPAPLPCVPAPHSEAHGILLLDNISRGVLMDHVNRDSYTALPQFHNISVAGFR